MREKEKISSDRKENAEEKKGNTKEGLKAKNLHELIARKDDGKTKAVKVESVEKDKFDFFVIVRWIVGLYIAGALAVLVESILIFLTNHLYIFMSSSQFTTVELSAFSNAIRTPFIILLITMPFILTTLIAIGIMNFILDKLNVFTEKHKRVYMILFSSLIALIAVSVYFSGA